MKSRFSLILIACVVIFAGILFASKKSADAPTNSNATTTENKTGEGKKGVTLTEYGDFQCPACGAYYPIVEQTVEKYKDDITFQFRNFPLRSIHPHALLAARHAQAAANQNKFWDMYNLLYKNQESWTSVSDPSSTFNSYAQSLNLDMAKYSADVSSSVTNDIINADIAAGTKLGVSSTPTFFIDGKKVENPRDADGFNKLIEAAIAAKK